MRILISFLNRAFAELCGWLLCVIMIFLVIDFTSRGLSMPIVGVGEVAVFAMIATVYLGLPFCEEQRGHVRVEAVLIRLPKKLKLLLELFSYFLAIGIIAIAIYAGGTNAISAYIEKEAISGPTPLLTYPVKFLIVVGLLFYLLQLVVNTFDDLNKLFINESSSSIQDQENNYCKEIC